MKRRAVVAALVGVCMASGGCSALATVGLVDDDAAVPMKPPGSTDGGSAESDAATVTEKLVVDDCQPGKTTDLTSADVRALQSGGPLAAGMRLLYPYDRTVMPSGLGAPLVMWDGPPAEAVYVHLHAGAFEYRGCLRSDGSGRLQLPQNVWTLAEERTAGASAPYTLELTTLSSAGVSGPLREQLVIASGALDVSIYCMTYGSQLGLSGASPVLQRLRSGAPAELLRSPLGCVGCHGVSANGERLNAYETGLGSSFVISSASPTLLSQLPVMLSGVELSALTPSGDLYVAPAHPTGLGPRSYGAIRSLEAALYETATGLVVDNAGIPPGAMVPAFSADGSRLTFSDGALGGHGLALMDFSLAERRATGYRVLYTHPTLYPGWPTFVPDARALVFALGNTADLSGAGAGIQAVQVFRADSDLYALELTGGGAAGVPTLLARAMGFNDLEAVALDQTYLPFGEEDLHRSFNPYVSPVAAGGYAWVFFDTTRHFGNLGAKRQIWGAALDLSGGGGDISHPAFHLSGQELEAANVRPVAAPNPP